VRKSRGIREGISTWSNIEQAKEVPPAAFDARASNRRLGTPKSRVGVILFE
jgi:hypothetical protein